jgi:hypothetical protein
MATEHEPAVFNRDVEDVAFADSERVAQVRGQHHSPKGVDAARAILRAHGKRTLPCDMRSVL